MSTPVYRRLAVEEYPTAVLLWEKVFDVPAPFFETLLEGGENISVGAFVDGELVSSVHVFIRWVRNRDGKPAKVGGIGSVSTLDNHRKQGHSGRLLEMAIAAMDEVECEWSYLGTGVNDHYARYGWWTFSTRGAYAPVDEMEQTRSEVRLLGSSDAELAEMKAIFDHETHLQPMAYVRPWEDWTSAIRYRLGDLVLGFPASGPLEGYLVGRARDDGFTIVELVGPDAVAKALTAEFAARAAEAGQTKLHFNVSRAQTELIRGSATLIPNEGRYMMARTIGDRMTDPDLAALLADPRGRHSDLDNF